jgi:hypothetical protein
MIVKIWFDKSNVPIIYDDAESVYQKGDLLCIGYNKQVDKYPIDHIFKINESNFKTSQPTKGVVQNG